MEWPDLRSLPHILHQAVASPALFGLVSPIVYLDRQMDPKVLWIDQREIHPLAIDLIHEGGLCGGSLGWALD